MTSAGHHVMLGGASASPTPAYWGLTFTAEEPNVEINMNKTGAPTAVTIETSTDGVTWMAFDADRGTTPITLAAIGDHVFFRAGAAGNAKISSGVTAYRYFTLSGKCAASGNCMSLLSALDPTMVFTAGNEYAFACLFTNCKSLTAAPELPATSLRGNCYRQMFQGCTSLTAAPELPTTQLTVACYRQMFQGCTSLASIKAHFTAWGTQTTNWVYSVAASGTFICPAALPHSSSDFGVSKIPTGWTVETF